MSNGYILSPTEGVSLVFRGYTRYPDGTISSLLELRETVCVSFVTNVDGTYDGTGKVICAASLSTTGAPPPQSFQCAKVPILPSMFTHMGNLLGWATADTGHKTKLFDRVRLRGLQFHILPSQQFQMAGRVNSYIDYFLDASQTAEGAIGGLPACSSDGQQFCSRALGVQSAQIFDPLLVKWSRQDTEDDKYTPESTHFRPIRVGGTAAAPTYLSADHTLVVYYSDMPSTVTTSTLLSRVVAHALLEFTGSQ